MAPAPPLFTAVTSSARQILLLLRCIAFTKKAHVRLTPDGLRFSTEEGSVMEASVFLDKSLFSSYSFRAPASAMSSSAEEGTAAAELPLFEVNLYSLLETLNIFSLSDLNASAKRSGDYDSYAAHRLNRHAGGQSFANQPLSVTGICTLSYAGEGSPLSVHMAEAGVTTTCELTTYDAEVAEEIPFDRENLALKTIMRATHLLDAITELSSMTPENISIAATPAGARSGGGGVGCKLALSVSGHLGSATVEFANDAQIELPILETFHCPARTNAKFKFALLKHAQRAMSSATKVSMRLDDSGVLSLQFLVEVDTGSTDESVAFVDFRVVPLAVDGDGEESSEESNDGYGTR